MAVYRRKDRDCWQARLAGPDGRVVSKTFRTKAAATAWHSDMLAKRERGSFLDPQAGKITFRQYFDDWSTRQIWEATTVKQMHYVTACVTFADVPIGRIRRSHIEQWVKALSKTYAPTTIRGRLKS